MIESRRFRIEGRVQGVWFRESTRQQAEMRGITGYARNCPDGSVEVVARGPAEAIGALRDWLRKGPPLAEVSSLTEWPHDGEVGGGFVTG
jgi:acylphosphatase